MKTLLVLAAVAFVHGKLFDSERATTIDDATIVIDGNKIVAAGHDVAIPPGAQIVDIRGKTILPGLWDMHTHLGRGDGAKHIAAGVTTVRDMGNDIDAVNAMRRRFDHGDEVGPRTILAGLVDGRDPLAEKVAIPVATDAEARAAVDRYARLGYVQMKIYSCVKPELVPVIAARAHERGMRVSGHVPAFMTARQAVEGGFDEINHAGFLFLNFYDDVKDTRKQVDRYLPVAQRAPRFDFTLPAFRDFLALLQSHHTVVDPTLTAYDAMFAKLPGGPYRDSFHAVEKMVRVLYDAHVPLVIGSDDAAGTGLQRALELQVEAGIPPNVALQEATIGAARVMHRDAELGSIAPGKLADLLVVDGDPTSDIHAIRNVVTVVKDGKFVNDKSIATNGSVISLAQQNPHPNQPTDFATTVRVRADDRTVSFLFDCTDPDPSRIAVHTMQRDGDMSGDDSVAIVLDTFGDGRTAYYFRVNAAGARADGLVSDRNVSLDWDGVWDTRVERNAHGWTARIDIPASTLRFQTATPWHFNAERFVARERQTLRWSGISLDASLADLARAGQLAGIEQLRQGYGVSTTVNAVARDDADFGTHQRALTGKPGLDAGYNVTPQLGGAVTLNTDFAETEVDTRQINLTRFPLFFPEKRTFFLEGSNHFNFGLGLNNDFIPFYSRRIGLIDGAPVPLDGGAKILGQAGRWGIDVLDVETGASTSSRRTNLFAGRVTFDVDAHLRVGAIATNGSPDGTRANRLGVFDATWSTTTFRGDKNLLTGAWLAQSGGDTGPGQRGGWGATLQYPNDLWNLSASVNQFGEALDPELGFLPRPGTRKYAWVSQFQPRPADEHSPVRQYLFEGFFTRYDTLDGRTQTWQGWITPFGADFQNGVHVEMNYAPEFERLDAPFAIADDVVLPAGTYRFDRFSGAIVSSPDRPLRVNAGASTGTFYDGRLTEIENGINWTSGGGRLHLETALVGDFGHLREGNFVQRLLQFRAVVAATPDLVVSSYWQYHTDSRQVGINNRVRWSITPYADLFVVWNRGWNHPLDEGNFIPASDQFVVKMRWTIRK